MKQEINLLIELEDKKENLEKELKAIQKSSPFCQLPNCYFEVLNEETHIAEQQANIFNEIRGFIINDRFMTIWQFCISKNMPVKNFGKENILNLSKEDLLKLKEIILKWH